MEEDWEEIRSVVSEDIEWVDSVEDDSTPASPSLQAPALMPLEIASRLRAAELRASVAEENVEMLTAQLRTAEVHISDLEVVVIRQQEENDRLSRLVRRDEKTKKGIARRLMTPCEPSRAHTNRAPQSVKLSKKGYWAKSNHRSSCIGSMRKI